MVEKEESVFEKNEVYWILPIAMVATKSKSKPQRYPCRIFWVLVNDTIALKSLLDVWVGIPYFCVVVAIGACSTRILPNITPKRRRWAI